MYACAQSAEWPDSHFRAMSLQEHYLYKCLHMFIKEKEHYLSNNYQLNPYDVLYEPRQRKRTENEIIQECGSFYNEDFNQTKKSTEEIIEKHQDHTNDANKPKLTTNNKSTAINDTKTVVLKKHNDNEKWKVVEKSKGIRS